MDEKEDAQVNSCENNPPHSRREFLNKLGAVAGISAAGLAALSIAQEIEAAATQPLPYPELAPSFSGAPSFDFLASGYSLNTPSAFGTIPESQQASTPSTLTNPNLLIIMVDELWNGLWLPGSPPSTANIDSACPNLAYMRDNSLRFLNYYAAACMCSPSRSTIFTGLYTRQTNMLLTQNMATTPDLQLVTNTKGATGFSTFGSALQDSIFGATHRGASPYAGNVFFCGKWHLSCFNSAIGGNGAANGLANYGFTYVAPTLSPQYQNLTIVSPDGLGNEGQQPQNGGAAFLNAPSNPNYYASDADIAQAAIGKLNAIGPGGSTTSGTGTPFCLVVSFVLPHDIAFYPAYFKSPYNNINSWNLHGNNYAVPAGTPYFSPVGGLSGSSTGLPYQTEPSGWNGGLADSLTGKPSLQAAFQTHLRADVLAVIGNDNLNPALDAWTDFLDNYVWIQSLADAQIGAVVGRPTSQGALYQLPLAVQQNTVVIFTTDHGDYAGSHGLHTKGGAAYEEAINIPLYVQIPVVGAANLQYTTVGGDYLCSAVDFFTMVVEFATGNGYWRNLNKYKDLYNRQSIFYKIYYPSTQETRTVTIGSTSVPYALFTTDEIFGTETPEADTADLYDGPNTSSPIQNHVTCIRTKTAKSLSPTGQIQPGALSYSGKFAAYDYWLPCMDAPYQQPQGSQTPTVPTQYEFYDFTNNYESQGTPNFTELGNQVPALSYTGIINAPTFCPYSGSNLSDELYCQLVSAAYGSNGSGVFYTELAPTLAGVATDGFTTLSSIAGTALTNYYNYVNTWYHIASCGS